VYGSLLVVDDDDDIREATRALMERHGWDVVAVGSGADALAYLAYEVPELVLLDLHMDDMNGWEVITMVRSDPRLANVKVVVVTGSDAAVAPPTTVLRKPFKIEQLLELLDQPPVQPPAPTPARRRSA
jgi:CheY-like chemotaxis protein